MNNYNLEQDVFNWLEAAGFERGDAAMQETAISLFFEELKEYTIGILKDDKSEQIDGLVDSQWALANCKYFGLRQQIHHSIWEMLALASERHMLQNEDIPKIELYQKAVSISNWSKFCESEAEAKETQLAYAMGKHPDKRGKLISSSYKQVGDKWVVFDSATRKVLKSINYITVQDALKTL